MTALIPITNTPRDYAWGAVDGVAQALGWPGTGGPEAELWLGAHPLSPSRRVTDGTGDADEVAGWPDLAAWEERSHTTLPYLLKVLSAASPLSLQAHPTEEQAAAGFAREQAAGVPLTARTRNYKDPHAKPELIVAVDDGFEALCGFRAVAQTLAVVDALAAASDDPGVFAPWRNAAAAGVREGFTWLLSGDPAVEAVVSVASAAAAGHPRRFELVDRLAHRYPGDPGILVAQMLNRVTLEEGEALWLPAGNIHAYLRGTGVELMGPSDNVLRGGLTPKHVDRDELQAVLDFTPGPPSALTPLVVAQNVVAYRPASVPSGVGVGFQLLLVTADARVTTGSAAIAVTVSGSFTLSVDDDGAAGAGAGAGRAVLPRGGIVFVDGPARLRATGAGRLFLATGL